MRATQQPHHGVRGGGELDILAGLIGQVIELFADMVGDGLHHGLVLARILPISRAMHHTISPYKLTLVRMAGEVTEVLAKVVVAGRAGLGNQTCWQLKILLHVLQLIAAAAQGGQGTIL